jgi:molecular chaperone GrpE
MATEKQNENEKNAPQHMSPGQPEAPTPGDSQPERPAAIAGDEEIARLKAEAADLKDRLLRAHAEMDNVRKRLEREKAEASKFAITKFARDVVTIGDNVQRAIDDVPHKAAEQDPALKSFHDGITMIERELINVLERHGIKRIDPRGSAFNPHQHQAVMEVPTLDVPSGTVTQVFQPGYVIEERVLRPAMVAVAKGGQKPKPEPENGEATSEGPQSSSESSEGSQHSEGRA